MSFSAVEAELTNTRHLAREDVLIAYDMRRSALLESDTPVKGLVGDVMRDFERSLTPHARLAQSVLKRQLVDPEPEWKDERLCVRFDLSELVRGTHREELETATYAYVNGLAARDESRGRVGWPPVDPAGTLPLVPHAQLQPGRDGRTLPPSAETTPGSGVTSVPSSTS